MSHDTTDAETGVPVQFERNRYFHGKLMTARDMTADQDYVRRRLAAVSRGVLGAGVVAGLDVTGAEDDDGDLRVTVTPGVALDSAGRTVVVPEGTGQVTVRRPGVDDPFPIGEVTAEGVALTLRYDHCSTERVPAPGNEHAGMFRGGGWLGMGWAGLPAFEDFAGSTVVHAVGGAGFGYPCRGQALSGDKRDRLAPIGANATGELPLDQPVVSVEMPGRARDVAARSGREGIRDGVDC